MRGRRWRLVKSTTTSVALIALLAWAHSEVSYAEAIVAPLKRVDPPQQVMIWVDAPRTATVGEEFELVITVLNARDTAFSFSNVSVSNEYIRGFEVVSVEPHQTNHEMLLGDLELPSGQTLPANAEWQVRVRLRAAKPGAYVGEVDIEFDYNSYWRVAQTLVSP